MNSIAAAAMIRDFELGIYPKEKWSHQAHFIMAFWYCYHKPIPEAIRSIKEGIKHYNVSVGGHNTADAGYHETITVFFTRQVIGFLSQAADAADIDSLLEELLAQPFLEKDHMLNYYKKETLMSREARKQWVEPDLHREKVLI